MFNDHSWKVSVSSWLGVSAAVMTAIVFTHSGICLIALFIPLLVSTQKQSK
jgi:hypothetical protein